MALRQKKGESGKSEFLEYAHQLVHQTNLRDLLPHVDLNSRRQVAFKILVALVVCCGFFYQTGTFLRLFLQYPSITDVGILYPEKILFPAVMICNHNAYMRTKYCQDKEEMCFLSIRGVEVCEANEELCQNKTFKSQYMFPMMENLGEEVAENFGQLERWSHGPSTLTECHASWAPGIDFCSPEYLQHTIAADVFGLKKRCYIINSLIRNYPSNMSYIPTFSDDYRPHHFSFVYDFENFEYFQPNRGVSGYMAFFDPYTLVMPYRDSFNVYPGKQYTIRLKPTMSTLLKAPYPAQCKDYVGERKTMDDPVSKQVCKDICTFELGKSRCSCLPPLPGVLFTEATPRDMPFCLIQGILSNACTVTVNTSHCLPICPKECKYMTYEAKIATEIWKDQPKTSDFHDPEFTVDKVGISHEEQESYLYNITNDPPYKTSIFRKDRFSKFIFELYKPELIVYNQKPKYESIELFSYVGGYMGMWLAMCLIMAMDIAEVVSLLLLYLFTGKRVP